jgi:hypothetical protein
MLLMVSWLTMIKLLMVMLLSMMMMKSASAAHSDDGFGDAMLVNCEAATTRPIGEQENDGEPTTSNNIRLAVMTH